MKKTCKKCGKKLQINNQIGYCMECKKLGIVALGIYKCIEPKCKNKVSKKGNKCWDCWIKLRNSIPESNPSYKDGKCCRGKIYHCIEPDCNEIVKGPDRRCNSHARILCFSDPKEREKIGRRGKNNSGWKGGITPLSRIIKNSDEYQQWRTKVFQRDSYTCKTCNKTKCYLEAHHKKYFSVILVEFLQEYSQFSPIEDKETLARLAMTYEPFWDINNGITLCKDCHKEYTTRPDRRQKC